VAVVLADAVAQLAIAAGDAELLHPGMLVGRHGLARQLTAEPIEFLAHDDGAARAQCAQGCSNATKAAANDEDVCVKLSGHVFRTGWEETGPRVSPSRIGQSSRICSTGAFSSTRRTSMAVAPRPMASRGIENEVKRRPGSSARM